MFIRMILFMALTAISPAMADTFEWTGSSNSNWDNGSNWTRTSGSTRNWPDDPTDIAKILTTSSNYPIIVSGDGTIEVASLISTVNVFPFLTLDDNSELKIYAADGLSFQGDIDIDKGAKLWVLGGGRLVMGNWLNFTGATSEGDRPEFILGDGTTLYALSSGRIRSDTEHGALIRGVPGGDEEYLVLMDGVTLNGSFAVDVGLVNQTIVMTAIEGLGTTNTVPVTMRLSCVPKMGLGNWKVNGGDDENPAKIIVDAALVGYGHVYVYDDGTLDVNRHFSLMDHLNVFRGGKLKVAKEVLFGVDQFTSGCDSVFDE